MRRAGLVAVIVGALALSAVLALVGPGAGLGGLSGGAADPLVAESVALPPAPAAVHGPDGLGGISERLRFGRLLAKRRRR